MIIQAKFTDFINQCRKEKFQAHEIKILMVTAGNTYEDTPVEFNGLFIQSTNHNNFSIAFNESKAENHIDMAITPIIDFTNIPFWKYRFINYSLVDLMIKYILYRELTFNISEQT